MVTNLPTQGLVMTSDVFIGGESSKRRGNGRLARGFTALLGLSAVLVAGATSPSSASTAARDPSQRTSVSPAPERVIVSGPHPVSSPTFDNTLYGTSFDLSKVGYEKSQFFLSGTAHTYVPAQTLTSDGKWKITTGVSAQYKTRIAVYRPINPKRFNGTVVVEWLNVSGGTDDAPDWTLSHNELVRDGFAWVGVSAQQVGVDAAKSGDPAEYSSLSQPGDSFSYDIFSQAGEAVRDQAALILGGLRPHTLIAAGESQSAGRLMTYIDAVQPITHVYQGFLVHSQFGTGAPLSQSPQGNDSASTPTTIRSDIGVPVLEFETETDVYSSNLTDRLHYGNPKWFRLWEVAGSSHYDYYGLAIGPDDTGGGQGAVKNLAAMQHPTRTPVGGFSCAVPINTGGTHWALDAAVYWLNRWVVDGTPPPRAALLATTQVSPVVYKLDADGNAIGGVRTPQVDAPIAALGSQGNSGGFCLLFGSTVPYTAAHLASLYKTHGQFVTAWNRATRADQAAGFLLRADAVELRHAAAVSQVARQEG
jgi:alpha/beta hydrolase family protein